MKRAGPVPGAGGAPGNADTLYNAGRHRLERERLRRRRRSSSPRPRRRIRTTPKSHFMLGQANLNLGKLPEAAKEFETYLKLAPNGPNAKEAQTNFEMLKAVHQVVPAPAVDATIAANLQSVRSRIDAAARRAGRDPSDIRLIAVSKTFSADHVRAARAAGQRDFGENKVQEALQKIAETADMEIRWHLIGHLQSNKAKKAATGFHCIHSVDSLELLRQAGRGGGRCRAHAPEILVQVDLAGETTKFGAPPTRRDGVLDAALGRAGGAGDGADADPALERGPGTDAPVVREAARTAGRVAGGRRSGAGAAAALDGDEPRFRGRHRGRRYDGARRHGDIRQAHVSTTAEHAP